MKPPTGQELTRIAFIAAIFCGLSLAAAFAGVGITALAVLAVVVGPASVLGYRALSSHHLGRSSATDAACQPYPG